MEWAPGVRKHLAAGDFAAYLRQILAFYSFIKSLSLFRDLMIRTCTNLNLLMIIALNLKKENDSTVDNFQVLFLSSVSRNCYHVSMAKNCKLAKKESAIKEWLMRPQLVVFLKKIC